MVGFAIFGHFCQFLVFFSHFSDHLPSDALRLPLIYVEACLVDTRGKDIPHTNRLAPQKLDPPTAGSLRNRNVMILLAVNMRSAQKIAIFDFFL